MGIRGLDEQVHEQRESDTSMWPYLMAEQEESLKGRKAVQGLL